MKVESKDSPAVRVKCVNNSGYEEVLEIGKVYTVTGENEFQGACDYFLDGIAYSFRKSRFEIVNEGNAQQPFEAQNVVQTKTIDSHYNFDYVLTDADREKGVVKIDPYFVSKLWKLGSKDDTGVLFHCLKNISRYSDKNSKEREIKALHLQIKRLAELEGVSLNEMVLEILDKK